MSCFLQNTKSFLLASQKIYHLLAYIHWNVNPNIPLPFDFFTVQWYGLMWSISIISCFYLGKWILKNENLDEDHLILIVQYVFIGAIVGARIGQVLFYQFDYFIDYPLEIFKIWKGGLSSHGGVLGGLAGLLLFEHKYKQFKFLWLLDKTSIILFVPAGLIRLGNLFNSELYGRETDVPWAFVFEQVDYIPRHPVVLYEAIAYFILFGFVVWLYRKYGSERKGMYTACFFFLLFSVRFVLEFYKEPEGDLVLGMISKTQLLSLPFIIIGFITFLYFQRKKAIA